MRLLKFVLSLVYSSGVPTAGSQILYTSLIAEIDLRASSSPDIVEGSKTRSRRTANAVARDIEDEQFEGNRYEFEVLVGSVESALRVGEKLEEIFDEGLVLYGSNALQSVRATVYGEEVSTDAD